MRADAAAKAARSAAKEPRFLLLIPDGVGVRNFLIGDFLALAARAGAVSVIHVVPEELLGRYEPDTGDGVEWHSLVPSRDTTLDFLLRYSLSYAQMYWANTEAMQYALRCPIRGSWPSRILHQAVRVGAGLAASRVGLRTLGRWHCFVAGRSKGARWYRGLLERIRPSVLFCSHPRPASVLPPVLAARSLGIPTATFIFSWDNLTSKGRIAAPFDHYLVWSDQMRRELVRYYPDIADDRIHIVGTPQFDPYVDERLLWSRQRFLGTVGADPSRRLICYSGGDAGTCPEDPKHVGVLMELIRGGRVRGNPQVLLRPVPVDKGSRYDEVRRCYPELIYACPDWVHTAPGDWSRVIPLPEDVQFLANLTAHADLNINVASTMTLDFAIHDKPVVNIAFDIASPPPFGKPLWDYYYQFEHYRPVVELGAARFARSPEELAGHVNAYLADSSLDRENRRRLVELEVSLPLGRSSQRILEVLRSIAA